MPDLLFKWEEGPGLEHHCGVCDRPLSHPRARTVCFGHHAEPCLRFHQFMFMPGRSHQCAACISQDEIHLKRHREIAEVLRNLYETCRLNISLLPPSETANPTNLLTGDDHALKQSESQSARFTRVKKRDKKTAKKAAKAAERPKVLTGTEIDYVGDVLHPKKERDDHHEGPSNDAEIEEIERNLRYHANCYNTGKPRSLVKNLVKYVDDNVDFESEMARIYDVLRIAELIKQNSRNRGLIGKDLKVFETLVNIFKASVIEDLVQVKKEDLELRMRRGGYLRYVNRQSYEALQKRHEVISWKTGEKIVYDDEEDGVKSAEKCPGAEEPEEHLEFEAENGEDAHPPPYDYLLYSTKDRESTRPGTESGADASRHCVERSASATTWSEHGESQDERTRKDSSEFSEWFGSPEMAPVSYKCSSELDAIDENSLINSSRSMSSTDCVENAPNGLDPTHTPLLMPMVEKLPNSHSLAKKADGNISDGQFASPKEEIAAPNDKVITVVNQKDVASGDGIARDDKKIFHDNKATVLEGKTLMPDTKIDNRAETVLGTVKDPADRFSVVLQGTPSKHLPPKATTAKADSHKDTAPYGISRHQFPTQTHQFDWLKYNKAFLLDSLSSPSVLSEDPTSGCTCRPQPTCPCHSALPMDPLTDLVYAIIPGAGSTSGFSTGPFNRLRARAIIRSLDENPSTARCAMIAELDVASWFQYGQYDSTPMPYKLQLEQDSYLADGPRTRQWIEFNRLVDRAARLGESRKVRFEDLPPNGPNKGEICYCGISEVEDMGAVLECSFKYCRFGRFHVRCLQQYGQVKGAKMFYCEECKYIMGSIVDCVVDANHNETSELAKTVKETVRSDPGRLVRSTARAVQSNFHEGDEEVRIKKGPHHYSSSAASEAHGPIKHIGAVMDTVNPKDKAVPPLGIFMQTQKVMPTEMGVSVKILKADPLTGGNDVMVDTFMKSKDGSNNDAEKSVRNA